MPGGVARMWRLALTLALNAIPAIDPMADPYLTDYEPPAPSLEQREREGVFITGATGLVGLHLIDHVLSTTRRPIYILVRARSVDKLRREAARYKLGLAGFESRVTILNGDAKRADLGLSAAHWAELARSVGHVFHLAANSSFVATHEVLRDEWLPSFIRILEFCAAHRVGFHMVGSVGRFTVEAAAHRTRRGVWTSGYMRCKAVQYALLQKFRAKGLGSTSWVDCAYIIGSQASGGVNPGFHDSMWKAAAIQRAVGVGFPGKATLVPVDTLVAALWLNATSPVVAPYMALRLRRTLTSEDIGVSHSVSAEVFREKAAAHGFEPAFIHAFVPLDIGELVDLMHKPFDAPPAVSRLFDSIDEDAVIAANVAYATPQFGQLDKLLPRRTPRPLEAGLLRSSIPALLSLRALRALRHLLAAFMVGTLGYSIVHHRTTFPHMPPAHYMAFLSHWTLVVVVVYLLAAARLTNATPPAPPAISDALWLLHSVALPASIAVVPLFWPQLLLPEYAHRPSHPTDYLVHGVNALVMLLDFVLSARRWDFGHARFVAGYGLLNMLFMAAYFLLSGCMHSDCDLDGQGHAFVYSVVNWRKPLAAASVSLVAIFVPVPLLSLLLSFLSDRLAHDGRDPEYPFGFNHNGTVALPASSRSCGSVAEVVALLRGEACPVAVTSRIRAVGSAKSNTRCLECPGEMARVDRMTKVRVAPDRKTVTAGAGVTLRELAYTLARHGLQLYSTVEIGNLTAGAMACSHTKNRHVPGDYGILSSYVIGVTLVDALGRTHAISETRHTIDGHEAPREEWPAAAEMMRHVRTSHGLLGIVCEVCVRVKPLAGRSIDHVIYPSASEFVRACADEARLSQSEGSIFAYVDPYCDRVMAEVTKPTTRPPTGHWFWKVREHFITVDYPLLFRVGDALPTPLAAGLYAALARVGELALTMIHRHASALPHAHIGWHDHRSLTKFQWTFLAFPLSRATALFEELRAFCIAYKARTGFVNAYFVSYVMEKDANATFSYACDGPVITIDPISANTCDRFLPFCEALAEHLDRTVGGLKCAFNQSIGVPPFKMGRAVRANPGAAGFLAVRKRCDPHGRFLNAFWEEVLAGVGEVVG